MLDINLIRKEPERIKKALAAKQADPLLVDNFLQLDEKWRTLTKQFDDTRAEQRKIRSAEEGKSIKETLKKIDGELQDIAKMREEALHQMPNPPLMSIPVGKDASENIVLEEVGKKPALKNPKDYTELAQEFDLIDTERAAKISGSRFGYLKGPAALMEFALVDLAMKALIKREFIPIIPPVIINEDPMWAMGYLERGRDEIYHLPQDNQYLIGTSEQSVGPMHQGEVLEDLPKRYVAFSTCFRREAGSYGKDTKGILRVHQFDKVEMVVFTTPEESEKEHQRLLGFQRALMDALELPYRVLNICSGDLGDPAAAKYDIEAWLPGQNGGQGEYRETHSTSNTTDFQSRRLNIKYKNKEGKTELVHMLNGTAFAIGRTILAILENYQTDKGTIKIPKVLQDYMGMKEINPHT
ncbi:MAG: serine--tRNA ligase [Candidatus Harrisonbacteria bacterium RIFCSPLOWO2_02_FULL_45_10c]|uniref:Serine--tRNA ligase n=1 Tax=Candidatus Harrisonbacteria bacterium RIFCSPLOWO2_02_FULL_45_10c TaxID=1798410 RepID=A0A1G1ZVQ9_9BACT|nr:MAG: serine--tRNA ligase [Candidatus Harrisonbacteria bacterium RIFCSPLOWO2_02_FULL_45_10c]